MIEPYDQRVQKLQDFLNDVKPSLKYEIVPLSDPFGPSISDPELQCIVVSEETRKGGEAVNRKRVENVRTLVVFWCSTRKPQPYRHTIAQNVFGLLKIYECHNGS